MRTAALEEVQGSTSYLRLIPFFFLNYNKMFDDIIHVCAAPDMVSFVCPICWYTRAAHSLTSTTQQRQEPETLECSEGMALWCVAGLAPNHIGTNDEACRGEEPSISSSARPTNAHRPALNRAAREASVQEMARSGA